MVQLLRQLLFGASAEEKEKQTRSLKRLPGHCTDRLTDLISNVIYKSLQPGVLKLAETA